MIVENARGKIGLSSQGRGGEPDEEDEEQGVFDIGADDDSDEGSTAGDDEEDEEEDDDEEEEEELKREAEKVMRKLKMRKPFVDEDGILGEKKAKQVSEKAWGKKKTAYYQSEDVEEAEGGSDEDGESLWK